MLTVSAIVMVPCMVVEALRCDRGGTARDP